MANSINLKKQFVNLAIVLFISIITTFIFAGGDISIKNVLLNIIYGCIIGLSIAFGSHLVSRFFFSRSGWEKTPVKSFTITIFAVAAFILINVIIVNLLWFKLTQDLSFSDSFHRSFFRITIALEFVMGLTIYLIILAARFSNDLKTYYTEISDIKSELAKYQYETLKSQMNPHFLFNTLNTLSGLIYEDVDKSDQFIHHFSKIYRYVLDVQHEDVVPLEDELKFIEHFLFLNNIRFENAIESKIEIGTKDQFLVPMALQILFENAIKHNQFNVSSPLTIELKEIEGYLQSSNNRNPKINSEESSHLGINNLKARYATLSDSPLKIEETSSNFMVYLPILKKAN